MRDLLGSAAFVGLSIFILSNSAGSLVWRLQLPIVKRVQACLYAFISVACLTNCNKIDASFGLCLHFYPLKLGGFARLEASVANSQTRSGTPLCLYLSRLLNEL